MSKTLTAAFWKPIYKELRNPKTSIQYLWIKHVIKKLIHNFWRNFKLNPKKTNGPIKKQKIRKYTAIKEICRWQANPRKEVTFRKDY